MRTRAAPAPVARALGESCTLQREEWRGGAPTVRTTALGRIAPHRTSLVRCDATLCEANHVAAVRHRAVRELTHGPTAAAVSRRASARKKRASATSCRASERASGGGARSAICSSCRSIARVDAVSPRMAQYESARRALGDCARCHASKRAAALSLRPPSNASSTMKRGLRTSSAAASRTCPR